MRRLTFAMLAAAGIQALAQTKLDVTTQTKNPPPIDTSFLNTLYPQLNPILGFNLYGPGEQIFQPTSATPALRIVGGAIPTSNPHVAGEWMTSPAGRALWGDGKDDQYVVSIAGSQISPPPAPTVGHLAVWGPGYTLTDGGPAPTVASTKPPSPAAGLAETSTPTETSTAPKDS